MQITYTLESWVIKVLLPSTINDYEAMNIFDSLPNNREIADVVKTLINEKVGTNNLSVEVR